MSLFARKAGGWQFWISLMASVMDWYDTCVWVVDILWLTDRSSYGKDRLWRRRNLPGSRLGLIARGEHLKFGKGGFWKGPSTRLRATSCANLLLTMCGLWEAVNELFACVGVSVP